MFQLRFLRYVSVCLNIAVVLVASELGATDSENMSNVVTSKLFATGSAELDVVVPLICLQALYELCSSFKITRFILHICVKLFFLLLIMVSYNLVDQLDNATFSKNLFTRFEKTDFWEVQLCFWLILVSAIVYDIGDNKYHDLN